MRNFNSLPEKALSPWLSEPSPQGSGKQRAAGLAGQSLLEAEGRYHGTRLFYELLSCGEPCGRMGRGGWPAMRSLQQWMASLRAARRIFLSRSKPTRKMD